MDYKYIVLCIISLAVIAAIIFGFKKIKAKILGATFSAENPNRINKVKIKGNENTIKQSGSSKSAVDNSANIQGGKNDIEQK